MKSYRDEAVDLLTHYLKMAVTASGAEWTNDNAREVERIVDCIIAEVRPDA